VGHSRANAEMREHDERKQGWLRNPRAGHSKGQNQRASP
jgi:hypothetical protein